MASKTADFSSGGNAFIALRVSLPVELEFAISAEGAPRGRADCHLATLTAKTTKAAIPSVSAARRGVSHRATKAAHELFPRCPLELARSTLKVFRSRTSSEHAWQNSKCAPAITRSASDIFPSTYASNSS